MKPFLLLLLFFLLSCTIFGSETFILPDNSADALYFLKKDIDSAEKAITVITPRLSSKTIRNALQKGSAKGIATSIITQEGKADDATYLAQFKDVQVLLIKGQQSDHRQGGLELSLLIIDARTYCISTTAFDEERMRHDIAVIECSSDVQRVRHAEAIADTLRERTTAYLR